MSNTTRLAAAGLIALTLAACSTAPAAVDPVPPPQRPYDAKTQLEYGDRAPPSRPRY